MFHFNLRFRLDNRGVLETIRGAWEALWLVVGQGPEGLQRLKLKQG